MLTLDEIEDSFDTAFLHTVEDLSDEQLQQMMHSVRDLRRLAPPSLAVSRAREIVSGVLARRAPPPPPAPEPMPEPTLEPVLAAEPEPASEDQPEAPQQDAAEETPPVSTAEDTAPDAQPESGKPDWAHPSVTLELPDTPLRRMMHWFFG